jgi:putative ABC transport system substrate-binding protein
MRRRDFITLLGGTAAGWPVAARAQQRALPVVGFLGLNSATSKIVQAVRQGLSESGHTDGRAFAFEFRWADGHFERLSELAAELVRRQVDVVFTNSGPAGIRALKALTTTIPLVFAMGEDPVKEGLVASLNKPGGNVTGFVSLENQLDAKRLALLHDTAPRAGALGFLVNPTHPNAEVEIEDTRVAAIRLGRELRVLKADSEGSIEATFAAISQQGVTALSVGGTRSSSTGMNDLSRWLPSRRYRRFMIDATSRWTAV